jgi:hypothetical protein
MNIDNNTDLMLFINQEKIDTFKVSPKKVYIYFYKCLQKTIVELDSKFLELKENERRECVVNGTKMFFYVFYSLLTYSNNLKLTIFLAERALLLYSEFIIMSRDKKIIDDYYYKPNLNDAISFAYKQTIGSLSLNELKTNIKLIPVRECSSVLVELYNKIYLTYNNTDLFNNYIESLNENFVACLLNSFNKLTNINDKHFLLTKLFDIINTTEDAYLQNYVLFLKVFLETILSICSKITGNLELLYTKVYKRHFLLLNTKDCEKYTSKSIYNFKKTKLYIEIKQNLRNLKNNSIFM